MLQQPGVRHVASCFAYGNDVMIHDPNPISSSSCPSWSHDIASSTLAVSSRVRMGQAESNISTVYLIHMPMQKAGYGLRTSTEHSAALDLTTEGALSCWSPAVQLGHTFVLAGMLGIPDPHCRHCFPQPLPLSQPARLHAMY